jgi:hypothetical protein
VKLDQCLILQANEQCYTFLRSHCADNKALAVLVLAEKKNIAYPQVQTELSFRSTLCAECFAGLEGKAVLEVEVEGQRAGHLHAGRH